jgi:hypothetical protein
MVDPLMSYLNPGTAAMAFSQMLQGSGFELRELSSQLRQFVFLGAAKILIHERHDTAPVNDPVSPRGAMVRRHGPWDAVGDQYVCGGS